MSSAISLPGLNPDQWGWLLASAFLIGMAKAGVKGLGMFVVPAMAAVFGGKASVGLVLPLLSMADVFAVSYYNRDAEWKYIWRLLPTAAIGVLIGIWVGHEVPVFTSGFGKRLTCRVLCSTSAACLPSRWAFL